jgi:hypothetical protein
MPNEPSMHPLCASRLVMRDIHDHVLTAPLSDSPIGSASQYGGTQRLNGSYTTVGPWRVYFYSHGSEQYHRKPNPQGEAARD